MKPIRKTRHALMFFGAGAIAAYFFDPESGPKRRQRIAGQVRSMTGGTSGGSDAPAPTGAKVSSGPGAPSTGSPPASTPSPAPGGQRGTDDERGPIDLATGQPVGEAAAASRSGDATSSS